MFTAGVTTGEDEAQGAMAAGAGAGLEAAPRWQVVLRRLEDTARARVKLEAIESALILEADACDLPRHLGYASLAELLERHLHYTPQARAAEIADVFRAQRGMRRTSRRGSPPGEPRTSGSASHASYRRCRSCARPTRRARCRSRTSAS